MASIIAAIFFSHFFSSTVCASIVKETLRFTWEEGAPNGQSRELIYTNGQFPGPPLIFNEDDDAEITVINNVPRNVTVHWHGLAMPGTPWSDGVPGLSQKPIPPGGSFVYRFKASPVGTHWYHSHDRMSLVDGLHGPIFVKPREEQTGLWQLISNNTDDITAMAKAAGDPKFMVISDWSQFTSEESWKIIEDSGLLIFCLDSILVNGVGAVYCPPLEFLDRETNPGVKSVFGPGDHVTDKGCFPLGPSQGGPWNYTYHPEKIPPHMQEGCIPSTGKNATIEVDSRDGWVSLNFIAAASSAQIDISIDEHDFWLYEIDGNYVKPRKFVTAAMSAGETFSIMVKLDKTPGTYTIRVPDTGATQVISAFANMVYKNSNATRPSKPYVSYGGSPLFDSIRNNRYTPYDLDTDHMTPWPPNAPPLMKAADEEYLLVLGRYNASYNYTMNTKYMYPMDFQADHPLLFNPNTTLDEYAENLVIRTKNGSWVDLILQVSTLPGDQAAFSHFMHKHGSKTWMIGHGKGTWNYSSVAQAMKQRPQDFNMVDPGYRDTWTTRFSNGGGYWNVLRYQVNNPGPWLFHCHIELHAMGGMSIAILDGVDAWPDVPPEYQIGSG